MTMAQHGCGIQARKPRRKKPSKNEPWFSEPLLQSHLYSSWRSNMLIPNPWPNYPMTRIFSKTPQQGDIVSVVSTRGDLEVPDDTVEALIEPVENGRPGAPAVAQGRIWSREWGCLEIKDHVKKQELAKEVAELKARRKVEAERPIKKAEKPTKKVENPTK